MDPYSDSESPVTREVLQRRKSRHRSRTSEFNDTSDLSYCASTDGMPSLTHRHSKSWTKWLETLLVLSVVPTTISRYNSLIQLWDYPAEPLWAWVPVLAVSSFLIVQLGISPDSVCATAFPAVISMVTDQPRQTVILNTALGIQALFTELGYPMGIYAVLMICQWSEDIIWILAIDRFIADVLQLVASTSLTYSEVQLFSALLSNLLTSYQQPPVHAHILRLQAVILSSFLAFLPTMPFFEKLMSLQQIIGPHKRPANAESMKRTYATAIVFIYVTSAISCLLAMMGRQGVEDTLKYVLTKSHILILAKWFGFLLLVIPTVMLRAHHWQLDVRRKVWHGCVVVMFLPAVAEDPEFTALSFAIALVLFILTEVARATAFPPIGPTIHKILEPYTDKRDTCGPVIVSHLFLLTGISLPVILDNCVAGIICLGLGDSSASLMGRRYGIHKWPGSNKSIEGTSAFVIAVVIGLIVTRLLGITTLSIPSMFMTASATALLEAVSDMNDNVVVPVYMMVVMRLLESYQL
uniref:dolichol kinase n=1 Tax=Blastobotrys adeninivorans TaxID=409370 RepID=A0A060T3J0_BLAAD